MAATLEWLEIGRIGSPFGVKGWMHVESYTDPPEQLLQYRNWSLRGRTGEPVARQVAEGREHTSGMVVRLQGIEDRDSAALWQGATIAVPRSELPPLKPREYYQADLMGLEVVNLQRVRLGEVGHFATTPAGTVMVIHGGGADLWVPATRQYLNKVDLQAGRIVIDWPVEESA